MLSTLWLLALLSQVNFSNNACVPGTRQAKLALRTNRLNPRFRYLLIISYEKLQFIWYSDPFWYDEVPYLPSSPFRVNW